MAKRKLNPKEIRLIVSSRRLKVNGTLKAKSQIHVARHTVNGNIIYGCEENRSVDLMAHYFFPFIRFIYDNAPMCQECVKTLEREGIAPPASNTGVNSNGIGGEDATQ